MTRLRIISSDGRVVKPTLKNFILHSILLVFLCSVSTSAQATIDLNGRATSKSQVTLIQLVRKIFPEAQIKNGDNEVAKAPSGPTLRHLYGNRADKNVFGKSSDVVVADVEVTPDGTGTIAWLLIGASEEERPDCDHCSREILAAFRIYEADAELIDAANIQMYDRTEFDAEHPVLRIAATRGAVVVRSVSQVSISKDTFSVVAVRNKKFVLLVDQFDTFREYMCGGGYGEDATIRRLSRSRGGYHDIEVHVTTEVSHEINDGADSVTTLRRRFRYVYGWDVRTQKYRKSIDPHRQRLRLLKRLGPCGGPSRIHRK